MRGCSWQTGSQFRGTFELDAAPFDWGKDYKRPNLAPEDVIVYEMGVRSFTADESSGVGAEKQGTYAGLMAKVPAPSLDCLLGHSCLLSGHLCLSAKDGVCCPESSLHTGSSHHKKQPKHALQMAQ